jgi:hypothetical protein
MPYYLIVVIYIEYFTSYKRFVRDINYTLKPHEIILAYRLISLGPGLAFSWNKLIFPVYNKNIILL